MSTCRQTWKKFRPSHHIRIFYTKTCLNAALNNGFIVAFYQHNYRQSFRAHAPNLLTNLIKKNRNKIKLGRWQIFKITSSPDMSILTSSNIRSGKWLLKLISSRASFPLGNITVLYTSDPQNLLIASYHITMSLCYFSKFHTCICWMLKEIKRRIYSKEWLVADVQQLEFFGMKLRVIRFWMVLCRALVFHQIRGMLFPNSGGF